MAKVTPHAVSRWEPENLSTVTDWNREHKLDAGLNWTLMWHRVSGHWLYICPWFPVVGKRVVGLCKPKVCFYFYSNKFCHSTVSCAWVFGMLSSQSWGRAWFPLAKAPPWGFWVLPCSITHYGPVWPIFIFLIINVILTHWKKLKCH